MRAGSGPTRRPRVQHGSAIAPKWVAPEDEQEPYESRRLWRDLTCALLAKDMDAATAAKGAVENAQRELRAAGAKHATRFFEFRDNRWVPRIQCVRSFFLFVLCSLCGCRLPEDPQEATAAVQAWIWSGPPEGGAATTTTTTDH
ncbi:hypothetical protein V8E53_003720 [Lactarius tabidus]